MNTKKEQVDEERPNNECSEAETLEEADVIIRLLERALNNESKDYMAIAAPELHVMKKVAIIRTSELELDLINPKIIETKGNAIVFHEPCFSLPSKTLNCVRNECIVLQNGFDCKKITLKGISAALVQHIIDHLNGVVIRDKAIKVALVREGGKIK